MQRDVHNWAQVLALPKFRLPESSRWWKIEPVNDDGDMGLWALKVPVTNEWELVAHVSEPDAHHHIIAVNHPFGLKFMHNIKLTDISYEIPTKQ